MRGPPEDRIPDFSRKRGSESRDRKKGEDFEVKKGKRGRSVDPEFNGLHTQDGE